MGGKPGAAFGRWPGFEDPGPEFTHCSRVQSHSGHGPGLLAEGETRRIQSAILACIGQYLVPQSIEASELGRRLRIGLPTKHFDAGSQLQKRWDSNSRDG